ncbi:MAG: hypothetical protein MUO72_08535 [Bacteroidales bacterium]|nr:hypothetical protein [Bacteroidales bacterium]
MKAIGLFFIIVAMLLITGCNSEEAPSKPGSVSITLNWDIEWTCKFVTYYPCWDVKVGLGYSQSDVDNEAYFKHKDLSEPGTYTATGLAPGIYFYKAKKTIRQTCSIGLFCSIPDPVIKTGEFIITSNDTTTFSVSL